jgi:hypothetical protein
MGIVMLNSPRNPQVSYCRLWDFVAVENEVLIAVMDTAAFLKLYGFHPIVSFHFFKHVAICCFRKVHHASLHIEYFM